MHLRHALLAASALVAAVGLASPTFAAGPSPTGHGPGLAGQTFDPGQPVVTVSANSDEKTATLEASYTAAAQGCGDCVGRNAFAVTVQTPVGQGSDYTNIATLNGLAKATTLGLRATFIWGGLGDGGALSFDTPENQRRCWSLIAKAQGVPDGSEKRDHKVCTPDDVAAAIEAGHKAGKLSAVRTKALQDAQAAFETDVSVKPGALWLLSFNGKGGYEEHSFFDATSLTKASVTKKPFQLGVAGTWVATGGRFSASLMYNHQDVYQDGGGKKTQTLCPVGTGPVVTCVTGFIGAPVHKQQELVTADLRYIASTPWGVPVGINPSVTYEANSRGYAVQLPIYLVANKSKNLVGGIRYDWTSEEHHSVVGVFLSSAFSVLPGL